MYFTLPINHLIYIFQQPLMLLLLSFPGAPGTRGFTQVLLTWKVTLFPKLVIQLGMGGREEKQGNFKKQGKKNKFSKC